MGNRGATQDGARIQSVDRAMQVLELLAARGWCGGTEVAKELGVHKSSAFRILATLERHGMVEQSGRTAKYRLGVRLPQLASAVTADLDLRRHARPSCEQLAERVGETVTLDLWDNDDVLHVDQIAGSSSVIAVNWLGRRTPAHCTASGKVFLAWLPGDEQDRILATKLEARTPKTVVDPAVLRRQLRAIRTAGFGYTTEELELGLNAVAAPVRSSEGEVVAAVNLSGPAPRLPLKRRIEYGELTKGAAAEVSRRLGYRGVG